MATLTSQLVLSLADRVSGPARKIQAEMARLTEAARSNAARMKEVGGKLAGAGVAMGGFALAIAQPIKAAVEFESKMADIRKVADFPTPQGLADLGLDLRAMSLRIPVAIGGLQDIAADLAAAGVPARELGGLTEFVAKTSTALGISAGETAASFVGLMNQTGGTAEQTKLLIGSLNVLADASAASAPGLLDCLQRTNQLGRAAGFNANQVAAMNATLLSQKFSADVASTSINHVFAALSAGESASKGAKDALASIGLNPKALSKRALKDPIGALDDLSARILKLPKDMQAAAKTEIFGKEGLAGVTGLIDSHGELQKMLDASNDKTKAAVSINNEFAVRSETTGSKILLFQSNVHDLSISIGSALLPALTKVIGVISPLIVSVREHLESVESPVIPWGGGMQEGRRCGRRRTAIVTTAASCAIRVT